jgi:hypothetical protein
MAASSKTVQYLTGTVWNCVTEMIENTSGTIARKER